MKRNVGGLDKILRIVIGVGLLAFAFLADKPAAYWGYLGIVPLATGALNFCPLYSIFGFSSCATRPKKETEN